MKQRATITAFFIFSLLGIPSLYAQEQITLTTYYPAPFGAYDRVRMVPRAALAASDCDEAAERGTMYYDSTTNTVQVCQGAGPLWGFMNGVWTQANDNVYLTDNDAADNYNLKVGIGLHIGEGHLPRAALHVRSSGIGQPSGYFTDENYSTLVISHADGGDADPNSDKVTLGAFGGAGLSDDVAIGRYDVNNLSFTENVRFKGQTGRVGIGLPDPGSKLTMRGAGDTSATSSLDIQSSSSAPLFFVNDYGQVGIGTDDPSYFLSFDKQEPVTIGVERFPANPGGAGMPLYIEAGGATANRNNTAGGTLYLRSGLTTGTGSSNIEFWTVPAGASGSTTRNPTRKMTILGNGNVGIGTAAPSATLDVLTPNISGTPLAAQIVNNDVSNGSNGLLINTVSTNSATNALNVQTGGTSRLYVRGDGNVGIGTTTPGVKLDVVASGNNQAIVGSSGGDGQAVSGFAEGGGIGVFGSISNGNANGRGVDGRNPSGKGVYGEGRYGVEGHGSVASFYASGPLGSTDYATFTGAHDVKFVSDLSKEVKPGMLVSTTGVTFKREGSVSSTLPEVRLSNELNDPAVFGVVVGENTLIEGHWYEPKENERFGIVNALGDGLMWVSNINGEIKNGDYITTSLLPGYGQKQDDNLMHSYTAAKATETVDWNTVNETIEYEGKSYKVYLMAVTYHSG